MSTMPEAILFSRENGLIFVDETWIIVAADDSPVAKIL